MIVNSFGNSDAYVPGHSITICPLTYMNIASFLFSLQSFHLLFKVSTERISFWLTGFTFVWYRVDFGDFAWFRLDPIVNGRLVGGFGRIKTVSSACHFQSFKHLYSLMFMCNGKDPLLCYFDIKQQHFTPQLRYNFHIKF